MFLAPYFSEKQQNVIAISAHQASHFAKFIAGDFNPIHDEDARRFCVPGDLIFALLVARFGIFQNIDFRFLGTVGAEVGLIMPPSPEPEFDILNDKGKPVIRVQLSGRQNDDATVAEALIREYVAFSGQNFPHILVPLMAEKGVMINPARPLVMYESMSLQFDQLDVDGVSLQLAGTSLAVEGKRGDALLRFDLISAGRRVGHGAKKLALGGLQPFDQAVMDRVIEEYEAKKAQYSGRLTSDA